MPSALIVDDHELFRAAARELVELEGYTVTGEAATGDAAIRLALELQPDLVLLDVSLPDSSGFDVAIRIAGTEPAPAIILVSNRDAADVARRARDSPAIGFIPKERLSGEALNRLLASELAD